MLVLLRLGRVSWPCGGPADGIDIGGGWSDARAWIGCTARVSELVLPSWLVVVLIDSASRRFV